MLALDIVGPLVVYRLARAAGLDEVWALVVSGALPAVGVAADYIRWRTLEVVGAIVLSGIALSIALGLITDSARGVLLEGAAITAVFGLGCLASLRARRPMIFYFGQGFYGGPHSADGEEMDVDYDRYPEARYFWRVVTAVWGVSHIALAAALAVIVVHSSTGTGLAFNRTVPWALNGGLIFWSIWWGERLRAQKPDDEAEAETS